MSTTAAGLIRHYLQVALKGAGVRIDSDVYAELDCIAPMLDEQIRKTIREEIRAAIDNAGPLRQ